MQIALSVVSPRMEFPGLDAGIQKLTQVRELLGQIEAFKKVEVKVGISGLDAAQKQAEKVSNIVASLSAQLKTMGWENASSTVGMKFKSVAAELKYLADLHAQIQKAKFPVTDQSRTQARAGAENLIGLRIEELNKQMAAEMEAAAASEKAAEKISKARKKAAGGGAGGGPTARGGGEYPGDGRGTLVSERFMRGDSGEMESIRRQFEVGAGRRLTQTPSGPDVEDISATQRLRWELRQLENQYRVNTAEGRKAGATERELAQVAAAHTQAIAAKVREMQMEETVQARQAVSAAAVQQQRMEARAAAAERAQALKQDAEAQARQVKSVREWEAAQKQAWEDSEARRVAALRSHEAGQKADWEAHQRAQDEAARRARAAQTVTQFDQMTAHYGPDALQRETSRTTAGGRRETVTMRHNSGQFREDVKIVKEFDAAGALLDARLEKVNTRLAESAREGGWAGRTFLNNTRNFMAWSASAAAVFGGLQLIHSGFESLKEIDSTTAILRTVLNGTEQDVISLRTQVLQLAADNGRGAAEAMDAAVRWARFGLSVEQTAEAVRVSLKAANVAEISTAEASQQLAAIYGSYGLEVKDLSTVLNQLNTVSNNFNVTNKDLLAGLARSSAIAKQAGLGFSELTALIGTGTGRTGRPGQEMGNAIKAVISALAKPENQDFMAKMGVPVKEQSGAMKGFSDVLREMYLRYNELSHAEQQEMLVKVGGARQVSRLATLLDGYIQAQYLSIMATRDQSSADRENANIRNSLISQLQSIGTEFQKLTLDSAEAGKNGFFDVSMNQNMVRFLEMFSNFLRLTDKIPGGLAPVGVMLGLMTGRLLTTAVAMDTGARKAGFLGHSLNQLRAIYSDLWATVAQLNAQLVEQDTLMGRMTAKTMGVKVGATAEEIGNIGGMRKLTGMVVGLLPMLARFAGYWLLASAAMAGINWIFRQFQSDAERATAKMAGFNAELERLKALAEGAKATARLGGTLEKGFAHLAQRNPEAARQALQQFGSVSSTEAGQAKANTADLMRLFNSGNREALLKKIHDLRMQQEAEYIAKRKDQIVQEGMLAAVQRKRIEDINARLEHGWISEAARKKLTDERSELEKQLAETMGKQREIAADITESTEETTDDDRQRLKVFEEQLKVRGEMIARLAGGVMGGSPMERDKAEAGIRASAANLADVRAQIAARRAERDESMKAAQQDADAQAKRRDALKEIITRIETARRAVGAPALGVPAESGYGTDPLGLTRKVAEMNRAKVQAEAAGAAARLPGLLSEAAGRFGASDTTALTKMADDAERAATESQKLIEARSAEADEQIKSLEEAERKYAVEVATADALRQQAELLDAQSANARRMNNIALAARVGGNEAAQDRGALAAMMGRLYSNPDLARYHADARRSLDAATRGGTYTYKSLQPMAMNRVEAEQALVNMKNQLIGAEERDARLQAEILNIKRQQNEEAAKALLMASREDQLRAALVAKYMRQNGGRGFSNSQFQFLSQETRGAIERYTPGALPPGYMNEVQGKQREMADNRALMKDLPDAIGRLEATIAKFPAFQLPGDKGAAMQGQVPKFQFAFVEQAKEMFAIAKDIIGNKLQTEMSQLRSLVMGALHDAGFNNAATAAGGAI